jgi:small subunit ribosomal protein S20
LIIDLCGGRLLNWRGYLQCIEPAWGQEGESVASHKSALKRLKQTRKRTGLNQAHTTLLRHQLRKLRQAIAAKDKAAAETLLKPTLALIDHSVHKGILHANTAARYKSRLTLAVKALA